MDRLVSTRRPLLVAAVLTLLLWHTSLLTAVPPAAAATGQSSDEAVPRATTEVTVKRGNRTVKVRPIVTVVTDDGREATADRVIVGFREGVSETEQAAVHQRAAATGRMRARPLAAVGRRAKVVDVTGAPSLSAALQAYRVDGRVAYAEPDYILHAQETPNDPLFAQQWGMAKIQAPAAWDVTHGSPSRLIAILDCGIYEQGSSIRPNPNAPGVIGHQEMNGKVALHQDFTGSATGADDLCNHGTHVAGIAAAATNNGLGVAGVGYATRLLNGKVLDDGGSGTVSEVTNGIRWAADNGAGVINMSLGAAGTCPLAIQEAIDYAWGRNVVIAASAGNDGVGFLNFPASCDHVLAVASTTPADDRSDFSNFGTWVDVAAPGSGILSTCSLDTDNGDGSYCTGYVSFNGTSMAAPHVAGLAALVWASCGGTSAQAVVDRITGGADAITGTGSLWQFGRINAARSVCVAADLAIAKTDGQASVTPGSPISYTITVTNNGPSNVTGATVVDTVPASVTGVSWTCSITGGTGSCGQAGGSGNAVSVSLNLTNGAVASLVVGGTVSPSASGSLSNTATVSAPGGVNDPNLGNNSATDTTAVITVGATTWYFAEGYTGTGFDEYLTLQNPNAQAAQVEITYYLNGAAPVTKNINVPANARYTVAVHETAEGVGRGKEVAAKVESTNGVGIVAERPMYFNYLGTTTGGHNVMGVQAPRQSWLFAEGYTGTGFDEYLTILNPNPSIAPVTITYYLGGGQVPVTKTLNVPASSRYTVTVHDAAQGVGRGQEVSARVETTLAGGIVVERPIYFVYGGIPGVTGGHNVMGAAGPQPAWFFPEGNTVAGWDEYLTIMNTNPTASAVRLTYYPVGAQPFTKDITVAANSRFTVVVHDAAQGVGRNMTHGTKVETTNGVSIVVERPLYFKYSATVNGGHDVMGASAPKASWLFAEGYTGTGFDEFLVVLNPNTTAAPVTITYYLGGGQAPVTKTLTVPANTRATIAVHDAAQGVGRNQEVSAKVETTLAGGIVVERPIYFSYLGTMDGGHTVMGFTPAL